MDGLNFTLPMSGCQRETVQQKQAPSLFDAFVEQPEENVIPEIQREKVYAMIADWQKDGEANRKPERFDVSLPKKNKK